MVCFEKNESKTFSRKAKYEVSVMLNKNYLISHFIKLSSDRKIVYQKDYGQPYDHEADYDSEPDSEAEPIFVCIFDSEKLL